MRKIILSMTLLLSLFVGSGAMAARGIPLQVEGKELDGSIIAQVYRGTTYVSLREVVEVLEPTAHIDWRNGQAVVEANGVNLTAQPGAQYIEANGRALYVKDTVRLESGRTLVPVRILASAVGAEVDWEPSSGAVTVRKSGQPLDSGSSYYNHDNVYWLSRIISAESQGEPLQGKIAVGNVILNRMASDEFPNSIYDVIFDSRWGGQFQPVRNGTIYCEPTSESVLAAKLVLEGAQVAGDSLYFLAPRLAGNTWIMENRSLRTVIGNHWFYA